MKGLIQHDQAGSVHSTLPINTSSPDDNIHTPESLQDALYRRTILIPAVASQAGYMMGLTGRRAFGQLLARLNIAQSKRV